MLTLFLLTQPSSPAMPASRNLSIVGASDETAAHIRLLMRMAGSRLQHRWTLSEGEEADLAIIEPHDDVASGAIQARYEAAGIPFAILCERDDLIVHGMALRRPLKLDQLVAILNTAGATRSEAEVVTGLDSDFYNTEFSDLVPSGTSASNWDQPEHALPEVTRPAISSNALDAFYLLVHGDPLIEPVPDKPLVDDSTVVQHGQTSNSARHAFRREDTVTRAASNLIGVAPLDVQPISLGAPWPPARESLTNVEATTPALPAMLRDGIVLSPVRVSADGLPDVVLDPKLRRFYTQYQLHELVPYADAGADVVHYSAIAGNELQRVRESHIPRSYDELEWLFALLASHGRLNPKLDPGGSYSIKHPFVSAPQLRSHGRIAALMATPMPLHEIARASAARMEEVFDIVNAYDAIGRIEYIPRQSLQPAPQRSEKNPLMRLFGRR